VNEVTRTIALCSKNSAPGIYQITPSMLQSLHHNAIAHVTFLLDRIFFSGFFPVPWKIALITPLQETLEDPSLPLSYRPITLLSALSKILENMNYRLMWLPDTNEILSHSQFGCRRKRSAQMALADLDAQIYEAPCSPSFSTWRTHSHEYVPFAYPKSSTN